MGLPGGVSAALAVGYARWDGRGVPSGLGGSDIPVSVRVSIVARDVDLWAREIGAEAALEVLDGRRGHAYDPDVVDAMREFGVDHLRSRENEPWDEVLDLEPLPQAVASGPEMMPRHSVWIWVMRSVSIACRTARSDGGRLCCS
jgi:hypothetical protein